MGPLINSYEEGENLGVYAEVQHNLGGFITTNATTYWPYVTAKNTHGTRGLRNNITQYLQKKNITQDPIEFAKIACTKGIMKAERNNNPYILTGDLNQQWIMKKKISGWTGISDWATARELRSSRQDKYNTNTKSNTRYSDIYNRLGGTENDHILLNKTAATFFINESIVDNCELNCVSDHLPITVTLSIPSLQSTERKKKRNPYERKEI